MAKYMFKGLEEYALKLSKLKNTEEIAGKAIHRGAAIIADEIRSNIEKLPVRQSFGTSIEPVEGVTRKGKQGLLDGFGISVIRNDNGYLNVKIGFDGYNSLKTAQFPQGQPNQLVARGIENGTSWLKKTPFVAPAVKAKKKQAIEAMQKIIDEETEKIMK